MPDHPRALAVLLAALAAASCGGTADTGDGPAGRGAPPAESGPAPPTPPPGDPPAPVPPPAVPAPGAPGFRRPDPAESKTTESGIRWEMVEEGTGAAPGAGDSFELEYAFWTETGDLIESSAGGRNLQGSVAEMPLPFLKEAPLLLREGGCAVFEVPSKLAFGQRAGGKLKPGAATIWRLRLVRLGKVMPVPDFVLPPEASLRRTASGLGIQTLVEGKGAPPRLGENVVVHYAGWLRNGTPFDASYGRGFPATFRLGEVIPGWNEGLQSMKPGGVALLVIPPELGYGARGAPPKIPGGATLVFRVELLEVKK